MDITIEELKEDLKNLTIQLNQNKNKYKREAIWCTTCRTKEHHKNECPTFAQYMEKRMPNLLPLGALLIQVDIGGHPPFPTGSKQFSGNFGNLLFLAGFNFRGHFEGLNEGFSRSRFSMIAKGMIEPPKLISSMIPFQRAIIHLKRRSYAKVTTPGS
jgi:hypothetical protein